MSMVVAQKVAEVVVVENSLEYCYVERVEGMRKMKGESGSPKDASTSLFWYCCQCKILFRSCRHQIPIQEAMEDQ